MHPSLAVAAVHPQVPAFASIGGAIGLSIAAVACEVVDPFDRSLIADDAGVTQGDASVLQDGAPGSVIAEGQAVYGKYCALCHGANGEGYVADQATALANAEFLRIATDDFLTEAIVRGRPGTSMSAWSSTYAGPLGAADVAAVVALLRSWQTAPTVTPAAPSVPGDVARGGPLFAANCASCHGATGEQGPYTSVANPTFLATATDGFLAYSIANGRPGTKMAAWSPALTDVDTADLVALIRAWQAPIPPGDVLLPGTFGPVILNPEGPEPDFVEGTRYTPALDVYEELFVVGAKMIVLDARAPSSYVEGHVAGAVDLPFYDVTEYASTLPRDTWIVCYCACPHAESGQAADTLTSLGFTKVTVIDEGFLVWQSRGYPVHAGEAP
jgi:cytochrome c oxidase cbb3-type subunit 3/ubiquinol-cytochrome c reductase cytochrome c subunit